MRPTTFYYSMREKMLASGVCHITSAVGLRGFSHFYFYLVGLPHLYWHLLLLYNRFYRISELILAFAASKVGITLEFARCMQFWLVIVKVMRFKMCLKVNH